MSELLHQQERPVRVGVIGVGNMGSAHVVSIGEGHIEGMVLTAAADIAPEKLEFVRERFPDTVCFTSAEELMDSGLVDAVIIAVPHYFHPPIAIRAFEKGLHVLTEKPAGVQTSAVREMIAAHRASGKVFAIMFNQRTNPLFMEARRIVKSGELGEPRRLVWIVTNWFRTQAYYDSGAWRASWKGEGGGVLLNQAPHNLDVWQWIFGMPKRVFAVCNVAKYHNIEVEDDATIYAEYENGAAATFITTTGEYPGTNRLEITGSLGKLVLEDGTLKHWKLDDPEQVYSRNDASTASGHLSYSEFHPEDGGSAHRGILQNFANAILKGEELLSPGEEGLNELSISNAAYLSSWTNTWAEIPVDEALFDHGLEERTAESAGIREAREESQSGTYKDRWSVRW